MVPQFWNWIGGTEQNSVQFSYLMLLISLPVAIKIFAYPSFVDDSIYPSKFYIPLGWRKSP